jgi:hypothetical protein
LLQQESALKVSQALVGKLVEQQLPAFARASQNLAAVAALLDALPALSTDGASEVYQRLKRILDGATVQQAES